MFKPKIKMDGWLLLAFLLAIALVLASWFAMYVSSQSMVW